MTAYVKATARQAPKSSAFAVTDIPKLDLWLRADLGVHLTSGNVDTWNDQSGSGNHFLQATANLQPLFVASDQNSQPGIRSSNGTQMRMAPSGNGIALGAGNTFFLVASKSTTANAYLASTDTDNGFISNFASKSFEWFNGADRQTLSTNATGVHILCVTQKDGVFCKGYFDNADSAAFSIVATVALSGGFFRTLFNDTSHNGVASADILEVLHYGQTVALSDISRVFGYLKTRYAL